MAQGPNVIHQVQPKIPKPPGTQVVSATNIAGEVGAAFARMNVMFLPPQIGSSVVIVGNGLHVLPQRPIMRTGSAEAEAPNASPMIAGGASAIVGFGKTAG